ILIRHIQRVRELKCKCIVCCNIQSQRTSKQVHNQTCKHSENDSQRNRTWVYLALSWIIHQPSAPTPGAPERETRPTGEARPQEGQEVKIDREFHEASNFKYKPCNSSTIRSTGNFSRTSSCPRRPKRSRKAGSPASRIRLSVNPPRSPGATRRPVSPGTQTSLAPSQS